MKKIKFLALIIVFITGCSEKFYFDIPTAESHELKGEISSYIEKRYPAQLINDSIIVQTDNSGKIEIHKFFNLDNELVKSIYYDGNGKFNSMQKVLTNELNKYIGTEAYDSNNTLISKGEIISSTDSTLVIKTINYKDNSTSISEMSYYKDRLSKTIKSQLNDSIFAYWKYFRDSDGLLVKTQLVNQFGSMQNTSFLENKYIEFDKQGNWIKRMDYKENEIEVYVYERIIEYRIK